MKKFALELAQSELAQSELETFVVNEAPLFELNDLQLALVGGGAGDVTLL
jgi:hypothetical protein